MVSSGLLAQDQILYVDILPGPAVNLQTDIRRIMDQGGPIRSLQKRQILFMWASPPCEHYNTASSMGTRDLELADQLVYCKLQIIEIREPISWYIENPKGLMRHCDGMRMMEEQRIVVSQYRYGAPYRRILTFGLHSSDFSAT